MQINKQKLGENKDYVEQKQSPKIKPNQNQTKEYAFREKKR